MDVPRDVGHLRAQLRRERLHDIEARLRPVRRKSFAVMGAGVLLSGPWIGFRLLIPVAVALVALNIGDRVMVRSAHPERWVAAGWAVSPAMIAASTMVTGGLRSPVSSFFAVAAVTLGARFEIRGVVIGTVYAAAMLLLATVGLDPGAAVREPDAVLLPLTILISVTILSTAVVQSDREHRYGAVVDPLTGLLNRTALAQRFAELEERAGRSAIGLEVAVLVGDVDHFKRVNDERGHAAGDAVLRAVADAMRTALRTFDLVFRLGGEEFVVLLPGVGAEGARETAERLREAIATMPGSEDAVTISFGVSSGRLPGGDLDALLAEADAALYCAKRSGRDRVRLAAEPAPARLPESVVA